jgi:integrase
VAGRTRFYTIGSYPDFTPDMARRESKRIGGEYDAGRDPAQEKKKRREVFTWTDLFDWYMENHAKPHKRTWEYDVDMNRLYCSTWKRKPYQSITADTITRWHKQTGRDRGEHQADRVLAMVKTVFGKAIEAEVIEGRNPARNVKKFFSNPDEYSRDRFLSGDELGRLLKALSEYPDQDMADYFMVSLFTGARRGNVCSMRWGDMDRTDQAEPKWTIPGTESKNKTAMQVTLVEPVLSILNQRYEDRASDEYVFPVKRKGANTPHLTEPKKAWANICEKARLENVRIHDLRRTLGSWQAMLGASLQVIGKSLGHKSTQSTLIYARLNDDPVRASVTGAASAMLQAANGKAKTSKTPKPNRRPAR